MNPESLLKKFQQLLKFNVHSWCKESWPCKEDDECKKLLEQLNELEQTEQCSLSQTIIALHLEKQLELFAFRCGKFGKTREDIKNAYYALLFCQSKEQLLVQGFLTEKAKEIGVSSKKLRKELPTFDSNMWCQES